MKRKSILLLCALTTFGAFAQKNLVDDVEHSIGGFDVKLDTYKDAAAKILPALENAESKDDAKTWFVAGRVNFGIYDQCFTSMQLGQDIDKALMGKSIITAYDYFKTALPLDTVKQTNKDGSYKMDKKGNIKVKTKYSKDIVNTLVGHHNDFQIAGSLLYELQDYKAAAQAWGIYVDLPTSGIADRDKFAAPDTTIAQIAFYRGVAAWQGQELQAAVDAFAQARKLGYDKKDAYDYAMNCYADMGNNDGIVAIAKEALPLFGDEDVQYINIIINDQVNKGNFDEANRLVEEALAKQADNAQLYNVKGVILEQQKDDEGALAAFKKAVELDPKYLQGQFNAGRVIIKEAVRLQSENESLSTNQYQKVRETQILPLYKEAVPYLEAAYALDNTDTQIKNLLRNIYYQLGEDTKLDLLEKDL